MRNSISTELSKKLAGDASTRVTDICADLTNAKFGDPKFDGVYSILCFLHIPKSQLGNLFRNLSSQMKPGAVLFIEDYFLDEEPNEILQGLGKDYIAWDDLPTKTGSLVG